MFPMCPSLKEVWNNISISQVTEECVEAIWEKTIGGNFLQH